MVLTFLVFGLLWKYWKENMEQENFLNLGLAQKAPAMAILFVVVALANIALPLTNAFVGEFMMFTGIFTSPVSDYEMITVPAAGLQL
jgi:NADH:ubiquinone oxidoreductase subunit 4 (chain M)